MCPSVSSVGDFLFLLCGRFFCNGKLFFVDASDGDGVAAELHDELAVTVNTDYITLQSGEQACQYAEPDVVLGEFLERLSQKSDVLRMGVDDLHEGAHHLVGNNSGTTGTAVVNQMIEGISVLQEQFQLIGLP